MCLHIARVRTRFNHAISPFACAQLYDLVVAILHVLSKSNHVAPDNAFEQQQSDREQKKSTRNQSRCRGHPVDA